jgi:hypothetical protein
VVPHFVVGFILALVPDYRAHKVYRHSSITGKTEAAHWTSQLQDNLEQLEAQREDPLDEVLTTLVRSQLVAQEVFLLLLKEFIGKTSAAPGQVFRKGLLLRLDRIREDAHPRLGSHRKCSSTW